jgi:hypothetical protein
MSRPLWEVADIIRSRKGLRRAQPSLAPLEGLSILLCKWPNPFFGVRRWVREGRGSASSLARRFRSLRFMMPPFPGRACALATKL